MESVYRSLAGIDVHKKMLAVVIRRECGEQAGYEQRKFGTTRAEIQHLAAWLEVHFQLHLTHPLRTRAPRGRKSDFRDAQRLADRWYSGDLEESFIPGSEQRAWRWLTRTRVPLKKKLGVIQSHVEGLLEQGGIKLSAVVSDLFGVSSWAMLEHIAQGVTDVEVLAREARGALRKKDAQLKEALAGQLEPVYRLLLRQHLGSSPSVAAAFASAEQFASWVGVCPGSQESAGVNYSHRSAKGNRYLRRLLCQIAWAAIHTKDTFFAGLFARLKPRVEGKGAAWAVAHRIASPRSSGSFCTKR